jgi:opacity protein-like surface antigen
MNLKSALFFVPAAVVLVPANSQAQFNNFVTHDAGWYWGADIGATVAQDGHLTKFANLSVGDPVSYGVGFGLDLSGGYAFNRYFSLEVQTGWSWSPIDSIGGSSASDSSLSAIPFMANVVLQYPVPRTRIVPYAGAGVGGALTVFDTDGYSHTVPGGWVSLYGSDVDFVFAWQAFAGVRLELNDKMSVGIGYRYLAVDSSSYGFESAYGGPSVNIGFSSLQSHLAALTFTMKF